MKQRIIDWLEQLKEDNDLYIADLAKTAKVSRQAASKWFKTGNVSVESLEHLSMAYNQSIPIGLIDELKAQGETKETPASSTSIPKVKLDQVMLLLEGTFEADFFCSTDANVSKSAFAVEFDNDSMAMASNLKSIPKGSVVVIDQDSKKYKGNIVLARIKSSNSLTLREFVSDAGQSLLIAANPVYKPLEVSDDVQIIGVAKQIIQNL